MVDLPHPPSLPPAPQRCRQSATWFWTRKPGLFGVASRKTALAAIGLFLALQAALLPAACGGEAPPPAPTNAPTVTPAPTALVPPTPSPTNTPVPTVAPTPTSPPPPTEPSGPPLWQYVNSGWVSPRGPEPEVFAEELRAFVISSQEELDAFERETALRVSRGNQTTLGRIRFPESVLLAAYYLWRPLQGDPLSVTGFSLEDGRANVYLELEEGAQGKEYPYLLAPMTMSAVDRGLFPAGEAVDFVFHLNGEPLVTVIAIFRAP